MPQIDTSKINQTNKLLNLPIELLNLIAGYVRDIKVTPQIDINFPALATTSKLLREVAFDTDRLTRLKQITQCQNNPNRQVNWHNLLGKGFTNHPSLQVQTAAMEYLTDFLTTTPEKANDALLQAAKRSNLKTVQLALDSGADPNHESNSITPLLLAASNRNQTLMELLLQHGADPNFQEEPIDMSALYLASSQGDITSVQLLIEHGANIDQTDGYGKTPYDIARENGHEEIASLLTSAGVN